jgi:hypothetical protein
MNEAVAYVREILHFAALVQDDRQESAPLRMEGKKALHPGWQAK